MKRLVLIILCLFFTACASGGEKDMQYRFGLKKLDEKTSQQAFLKSKFGLKPKQAISPPTDIEVPPTIFVVVGGVTGESELHLYTTLDGITWEKQVIDTPSPGYTPWYPSCIMRNGKLHVFFNQTGALSIQHLFHLMSPDLGVTFMEIHDVGEANEWPRLFEPAVWDNDVIWIFHVTGTWAAPYPIKTLYSGDGGQTWNDSTEYNNNDSGTLCVAQQGTQNTVLYWGNDVDPPWTDEALYFGFPYQGVPPSLAVMSNPAPESYGFEMDWTGENILMGVTGLDGHSYSLFSQENGYSFNGPYLIKEDSYVMGVGINRANPETLYAVLQDGNDWETTYFCTSTNGGETWAIENIGSTYWTSPMTLKDSEYYFLAERLDAGYNYTIEVYSNKWGGFSRIPQLDGEESLLYRRAVAVSGQ